MQRWFIYLFFFVISVPFAFSQAKMSAVFDKSLYYTENLSPYFDTFLWIDGKTITYVPISKDSSKAEVDVLMLGAKGDSVYFYDRVTLYSVIATADSNANKDLLHIGRLMGQQQNIVLELQLTDLNDASNTISSFDTLDLRLDPSKLTFSQIEFIKPAKKTESANPYSKYGVDIIPTTDEISEQVHRIDFFIEAYNAAKIFGENQPYLLKYYIQNYNNRKVIERYTFSKRQDSKNINPFIGAISIDDLPSGHYLLVIEARDKDAKLVSKQTRYFKRENTIQSFSEDNFVTLNIDNTFVNELNDVKELREDILSLRPIAGNAEYRYATNVVKNGDINMMKRFLYSFWREFDNENPAEAYYKYKKQVLAVNDEFSAGGIEGYKTDRGRVYLQYGPPIARVKRYHEPANYPYEIWQYDKIGVQTNIRFVFYNQDAMASNNFILLHSDLRGEINNRQWEMYLSKQSRPSFGIDDNSYGNSQNGNRARDFYNNPR